MQTHTLSNCRGESAFHSISDGLAWAKRPMENRIGALDKSVPLTVIYGGDSWITRLSEEKFIELRGKDAVLTKVSTNITLKMNVKIKNA